MARVSTFVKGSSVFTCSCCGRRTRFTGDQSVGSTLCPQCWDLAGYENQLSDDGELSPSDWAAVGSVLGELLGKGVDAPVLADAFPTLWERGIEVYQPAEERPTVAPGTGSGFEYATKAQLAAMSAADREAYRAERRRFARAARRARAAGAA